MSFRLLVKRHGPFGTLYYEQEISFRLPGMAGGQEIYTGRMELQTPDAYVACLNSHLRQDISESVYMQGPRGFWKQKFSPPGGSLTCFLGPPLKEGLPRLLTMGTAFFYTQITQGMKDDAGNMDQSIY